MSDKFEAAKALFGEEKYAESRDLLNAALVEAADDAALTKQINMWLRKCSTHLTEPAKQAEAPSQPATTAPAAAASSAPAVRFEWFQTLTNVTFTFYVKNRQASDVAVAVHGERSVDVTIKLDDSGREYQYSNETLFAPVTSTASVSVRSMKVEVSLPKVTAFQWPALEAKGEIVAAVANPATVAAVTAPASAAQLSYPNSKGKDWSKVQLEEKEEGEEKPSGDHALNALFKQIYGNASDDQRRAMMKSYSESNGTVLSTNWQDVGSKYVKGEPPKGMEMKPINE